MKKIALLGLSLLLIGACKKDSDTDGTDGGNGGGSSSGMQAYIGIEGTSPNGISSLALYNVTNQSIENNVFRKANINPMGSQLSDMMLDKFRNQLVLIVPGSNKIVFVDAKTLKIKFQTRDLLQIRKVAQVSDNLYYVTCPELPGYYVINANNGNVVDEITFDVGVNQTEIAVWEDLAFICNNGDPISKDSTVSIVRTTEDTLVTNLIVGHSPNSFVIDDANQLWILCSGDLNVADPTQSGAGSLWMYNLDTMYRDIDSGWAIAPDTVKYFVDNQLRPHYLTHDEAGDNLYYITNLPTGDIAVTNTNVSILNENPIVEDNFYALAFDPINLELYGMRTPDDIEKNGALQIFDPVGSKKTSITIGVKPNNVVFK